MVSMTAPLPWTRSESRPVNASLVLTSMVSSVSRSKRPRVSISKLRTWPGGMGPPGTVKTVSTPGTWGRAASSGALLASSAMAATPWLAMAPTLQTSARCEWTATSGGDRGWDPAGVRFSTVTCQRRVPPSRGAAPAGTATTPTRRTTVKPNRKRFIAPPWTTRVGPGQRSVPRRACTRSGNRSMAAGRSSPSPKNPETCPGNTTGREAGSRVVTRFADEGAPVGETLSADAVVIGMGPGGEDVAGRLAEAGLDVVGVERQLVGGERPYWGCVPSKMMIRAANLLAEGRRIPGMAGDATVRPDWAPLAQRIRDEATDDWDDRVAVERFEAKGGRFLRGEGRILAPGRVAVGEREIEAHRGIVVATGTHAVIPPIPGLGHESGGGRRRHGAAGGDRAGVPYWTNREAIEAKELPSSLIVLGGGPVGVELAQVFARFGVAVTVVEMLDRLVPGEEPETGRLLADVFEAEGVAVRTSARVRGVHRDGARLAVGLEDGTRLAAAQLLVATGRRADLPAVGVDETRRWVPVDEHLRVTDGVWAVGDVTGKGAFTHVAMYQSAIAAADILGRPHTPADYQALPRVTFTDPEIGAGSTGPATRASSSWSRTPSGACWSALRPWAPRAARSSAP